MNGAAVGGRQMQQRTGGQFHQRQYSSDQIFPEAGGGGASKWLQLGGLPASQQVIGSCRPTSIWSGWVSFSFSKV